ncbi:hypothetical protein ACM16X_16640 [Haloarcula japonica]|uniref:hypothetical protein n=1 Tax=Haloarcula japonica TaxID=29282 RepID=UPI0039F6E1AA
MVSRRTILKTGCSGTIFLAGCTSSSNNPQNSTESESSSEGIGETSERLTCGNITGTHILTVTPQGYTLTAANRQTAESFINDVNGLEADDITAINPSEVTEIESSEGYLIEFNQGNYQESDMESFVNQYDGINSYSAGVSRLSLIRTGRILYTRLQGTQSVSDFSVFHVVTNDSSADLIAADITALEDGPFPSSLGNIAFHIQVGSDETITVRQSDLSGKFETYESTGPRVVLSLPRDALDKFQELVNQGAFDEGSDSQIRVKFREETIFEGGINQRLRESIKSDSWDGEIAVPFENSDTAKEFATVLNLDTLGRIATESNIEVCEQ